MAWQRDQLDVFLLSPFGGAYLFGRASTMFIEPVAGPTLFEPPKRLRRRVDLIVIARLRKRFELHARPIQMALFFNGALKGRVVNLSALRGGLTVGLRFVAAQTAATIVAMTSNFFLNNLFTYRDQRLRKWQLIRGLLSFYLICSIGAVANVGFAAYVFRADQA